MFSKVISAAVNGIESKCVLVEADVSDGLPMFSMVGYLASEVREAQDRVRTALKNSGYALPPKHVTVNLAPGDIRKSGTRFDLPIAAAVMASYGFLPQKRLAGVFFAGELGLDGSVQGIHGILSMVLEARRAGCHACLIPWANRKEGAAVQGIDVYGVRHLKELENHLNGTQLLEKVSINIEEKFQNPMRDGLPDFADICGQRMGKRAAEIAAAGMHNLLISGPPGAGKSMIAKRIPSILPSLTMEESLEVSGIHSIAGTLPEDGILTERPFRMPHHTISAVALTGGGATPRPGEISLAHRGVLYLDELPEFQREALEILRQPLEDGVVRISRNRGQYVFPADFMLVASRNPCRCGYYPDRTRCHCRERDIQSYLGRISRPLLDRIDLYVEAEPVQYEELTGGESGECSAQIRARVEAARVLQQARYAREPFHFNAQLPAGKLEQYCALTPEGEAKMREIYRKKQLTARSYHRLLKVARTIADLEGSASILERHLDEAVLYRAEERLM